MSVWFWFVPLHASRPGPLHGDRSRPVRLPRRRRHPCPAPVRRGRPPLHRLAPPFLPSHPIPRSRWNPPRPEVPPPLPARPDPAEPLDTAAARGAAAVARKAGACGACGAADPPRPEVPPPFPRGRSLRRLRSRWIRRGPRCRRRCPRGRSLRRLRSRRDPPRPEVPPPLPARPEPAVPPEPPRPDVPPPNPAGPDPPVPAPPSFPPQLANAKTAASSAAADTLRVLIVVGVTIRPSPVALDLARPPYGGNTSTDVIVALLGVVAASPPT